MYGLVDENVVVALKVLMHLLPVSGKKQLSSLNAFNRLFYVVSVSVILIY